MYIRATFPLVSVVYAILLGGGGGAVNFCEFREENKPANSRISRKLLL